MECERCSSCGKLTALAIWPVLVCVGEDALVGTVLAVAAAVFSQMATVSNNYRWRRKYSNQGKATYDPRSTWIGQAVWGLCTSSRRCASGKHLGIEDKVREFLPPDRSEPRTNDLCKRWRECA